jgi:hypothetical protein
MLKMLFPVIESVRQRDTLIPPTDAAAMLPFPPFPASPYFGITSVSVGSGNEIARVTTVISARLVWN